MIPRSFQLCGLTIDVKLDPDLYRTRKIVGEARYPDQLIILDTSTLGLQSLEQSYLHELVHWVFYILNEDEIRNNEKLVDQIAYLLHQSLQTKGECYTPEELGCADRQ